MIKLRQPALIGFIYGLASFAISFLLFYNIPRLIGISTILFVVILIIPRLNKLLEHEEKIKIERQTFWKRHKQIINFYIDFFVGLLMIFFLLSILFPELMFSRTQLYGIEMRYEKPAIIIPYSPGVTPFNEAIQIVQNNLFVMILSFILSIFAGAGSIFLITLNASIFATLIADIVRLRTPEILGFVMKYGIISCNLGLILVYAVPEAGSYLIAAIAGGILGKAIQKEKIKTTRFLMIIKECLKFLAVSVVIITVSALIEVYIIRNYLFTRTCIDNPYTASVLTLAIIAAAIILRTYLRRK